MAEEWLQRRRLLVLFDMSWISQQTEISPDGILESIDMGVEGIRKLESWLLLISSGSAKSVFEKSVV